MRKSEASKDASLFWDLVVYRALIAILSYSLSSADFFHHDCEEVCDECEYDEWNEKCRHFASVVAASARIAY